MSLTPAQLASLDLAARAAWGTELETGCPAELTLAQWALESGWGEHQPRNNCFGIKAQANQAGQTLPTKETLNGVERTVLQRFRVYDSLQECFEDHARLLTRGPNYIVAFNRYQSDRNLTSYVEAVAAKYATAEKDPDPKKRYSPQLLAIIAMPAVQSALAQVRHEETAA